MTTGDRILLAIAIVSLVIFTLVTLAGAALQIYRMMYF